MLSSINFMMIILRRNTEYENLEAEHGFCALIDFNGRKILLDAGRSGLRVVHHLLVESRVVLLRAVERSMPSKLVGDRFRIRLS